MSLKTTVKEKTYGRASRIYKTQDDGQLGTKGFQWWVEKDTAARAKQLFATVAYLKERSAI
jgi:hypothetical protein